MPQAIGYLCQVFEQGAVVINECCNPRTIRHAGGLLFQGREYGWRDSRSGSQETTQAHHSGLAKRYAGNGSNSCSRSSGQLEKSNPAVTEMKHLNKEVKRRADVVGIFPNEESIIRLLGAVLTEQNEEWLLQNRYLPQHSMAEIEQTAETEVIDALPLSA
ncbi:transposase, Mutator family protein [Salmonella enterica subsp. enterica serovar Newport str. SHSN006]|nr:transposase, Mutator family protein [Salmonella enterica subsp. enterica serovar Newport str. SHSN005]OSJ73786.1 transposase, Mutator family protein [Salmonella enterica subsp. enterica serovar Newport str. SHSN006]OSJ90087.1 transposase, Mutator family protein [Salmonella enterica subsp. enterica serovar Newport str. SHSN011]